MKSASPAGPLALSLALLLTAGAPLAAPQSAAVLTLQYEQSEHKSVHDAKPLFGHYLGSGTGIATGDLHGTLEWDLYEDQSRDDLHPAHFHGVLERDGKRFGFQIIGVYTPEGDEKAVTPAGHETHRYWTLSGTIVFEDIALLGVRHAPITGSVDTGIGEVRHTIWTSHDRAR